LTGLFLVTLILLLMLGDLRTTLIAAATIPFAVLFAFSMMALTGQSANLISIGAIDFGILVDASIIVLESVFRKLSRRKPGSDAGSAIVQGVEDAARPVLFSTLIILIAFVPLFTMQGVPGKIFAPMSVTYGFALTGALIFALLFAPVLASYRHALRAGHAADHGSVRWLKHRYERLLIRGMRHRKFVIPVAVVFLLTSLVLFWVIVGEFMPKLEVGNLWI